MENKGNITLKMFKDAITKYLNVNIVNGSLYLLNSNVVIAHDEFANTADLILKSGHSVIEWHNIESFELFLQSIETNNNGK